MYMKVPVGVGLCVVIVGFVISIFKSASKAAPTNLLQNCHTCFDAKGKRLVNTSQSTAHHGDNR